MCDNNHLIGNIPNHKMKMKKKNSAKGVSMLGIHLLGGHVKVQFKESFLFNIKPARFHIFYLNSNNNYHVKGIITHLDKKVELRCYLRHFVPSLSTTDVNDHIWVGVLRQSLWNDSFATPEGSGNSRSASLDTSIDTISVVIYISQKHVLQWILPNTLIGQTIF